MNAASVISLAFKSLKARRLTALLTIISIATAVLLFVAVENLRQGARTSFERTITETDLIVGARSSSVNLVLYSVFQIGDATNNITWKTYEDIKNRRDVAWTVPISLGDSHRGYRVLGTNADYFTYYKYGNAQTLQLAQGEIFSDIFDVVVGAQVARELKYNLSDSITLSHGMGVTSFTEHKDTPFKISGILKATGTPVDRSVIVSLPAIEAIHVGWQNGTPTALSRFNTPEKLRKMELAPKEITAAFVGATSRTRTLRIQRDLNTYKQEPLQAVIPGVALSQLWNMLSVVERALAIVSAFVIAVGLIGILTSILTSLNERRREMAILRSIGARPLHILGLLVSEAALLAFIGASLGVALVYGGSWLLQGFLEARFNISTLTLVPGWFDAKIILGVTLLSALLGLIPALISMKRSLADGLAIRF